MCFSRDENVPTQAWREERRASAFGEPWSETPRSRSAARSLSREGLRERSWREPSPSPRRERVRESRSLRERGSSRHADRDRRAIEAALAGVRQENELLRAQMQVVCTQVMRSQETPVLPSVAACALLFCALLLSLFA